MGFFERQQRIQTMKRLGFEMKQESGETPTYYNGITGKLTHVTVSGRYLYAMVGGVSIRRVWNKDDESVKELEELIGQDVFTTVYDAPNWSPRQWFNTIQPIGNRKLERN